MFPTTRVDVSLINDSNFLLGLVVAFAIWALLQFLLGALSMVLRSIDRRAALANQEVSAHGYPED